MYRITADNSLNPKTRYNALISLSSVGALPWYRRSFSTTLGLSLWCVSSSCSARWGPIMPLPVASLANSTYVLRIEATAGEQSTQQWVAFRIAR